MEDQNNPQPKNNLLANIKNILFFPFGCLAQTPSLIGLILLLFAFAGFLQVTNQNSIFLFPSQNHLPQNWTFTNNYLNIQVDETHAYSIDYENSKSSQFNGLVRFIAPINESRFPVLSHDILITTGDYANPEKVKTSVSNHHYSWKSNSASAPVGSINLLHTVPMNQQIYDQLISIRKGDQVTIQGREIYKINLINLNENDQVVYWQDAGCNTILVTEVSIYPLK